MTNGKDLIEWHEQCSLATGLTKREYFAAMVLQGLVSKYTMNNPQDQATLSQMAVELTDTFINHLNR